MITLGEFSRAMTEAQKDRKITAIELAKRTGLTPQAVRQILSGVAAPRLTNAMALASELGLELVLLPKDVAHSIGGAPQAERKVITDLERRLGLKAVPPPSPPRR
ncbi:MAG: helix-turn-helix domain-containing protein [Flavobacteriales bacterium]